MQAYRALFNFGNLLCKAEAYGRVPSGGSGGAWHGSVAGGAAGSGLTAGAFEGTRPSRMEEAVDVFQRAVHLVQSGADAYFQPRRLLSPLNLRSFYSQLRRLASWEVHTGWSNVVQRAVPLVPSGGDAYF